MGKTPIEWADHSINPLRARNIETGKVGHFCVKISAGCKNCYSSKMQKPFLTQLEFIAENRPKVELIFDQKAIRQVLSRRVPTRYFWCDMTDLFGDWVSDDWIDHCVATMLLTPWHTHMVLTKRADRMETYWNSERTWKRLEAIVGHSAGSFDFEDGPPMNVWLGVSVEDRARLPRIAHLRRTEAYMRFISFEPLLEDLGDVDLRDIDWAIIGGESGPDARSMKLAWARRLLRQCRAQDVAPFFKQAGGNLCDDDLADCALASGTSMHDKKGGNPIEWTHDLRVREYPE